jgi:hypothetical protein
MGHTTYQLVMLSMATATCSLTIADAKVFKPIRDLVRPYTDDQSWVGKRRRWLYGLISCSYCVSLWTAGGLAYLATHEGSLIVYQLGLLNGFVVWLSIVCLATLISKLMRKAIWG